jgi:hypothetical protein
MDLKVICLETPAYYELIQEVISLVKDQKTQEELWVDTETAMSILKISSKTTLQKYRDENRIRFSQLSRKVILYYRPSLLELLEKNVIEF